MSLQGSFCTAINPAIKIESIYISGNISLQVKLYETEVKLFDGKMKRLVKKRPKAVEGLVESKTSNPLLTYTKKEDEGDEDEDDNNDEDDEDDNNDEGDEGDNNEDEGNDEGEGSIKGSDDENPEDEKDEKDDTPSPSPSSSRQPLPRLSKKQPKKEDVKPAVRSRSRKPKRVVKEVRRIRKSPSPSE